MTSNKNHWSYLAALYDGEGCFHIRRMWQTKSNCYSYFMEIPISMSSLSIMKWLVRHFGGVYYTKTRDKRYVNAKLMYHWTPKGLANKRQIILGIMPYLIEKLDQAKTSIQYLDTSWGLSEEKDRLYWMLRQQKLESVETNMLESEDASDKIEPELMGNHESELTVTLVS